VEQVSHQTPPDDTSVLASHHDCREHALPAVAGGRVIALIRDHGGDLKASAGSVPTKKSAALAVCAAELARALAGLDVTQRLRRFRDEVDGPVVFTTGFGLEGQVILHHIWEAGLDIDVVTLDTGRLFPETYATWEATERRYDRRIRAIYPRRPRLEALIADQGINGFYRSKEARTACCDARKVEPLRRALTGAQGWITGLRADQSAFRNEASLVDHERNLLKLNPLIDWTRQDAEDFAAAHDVPVNPLHQKGFPSIGCAPCTRAVRPGEPERAGRWWWEDESKKECGLHVAAYR
jgi:phosphoadenosine phosphosulfate reductase